jgi:LysM repeat protein
MVKRTAAMRILACMAVVVLVAGTALAGGSKNGVVTVNNGRMTVATKGGQHVSASDDSGDATLSTIFTNLGSGGTVYNCCNGWTISGVNSLIGAQNWIGEAFTPANNATVTKVKVAVGYVTGTNGVTFGLSKDKNGVPGKLLKSWSKVNLPTFGTCCTLLTGKDAAGIPVKAGVQYWVIVKTNASTSDTWDAFNISNSGVGTLANNTGSGWVNLGSNQQAAFAVLGN